MSKALSFDEARSWRGMWRSPDEGGHDIPGVLSYDREAGLTLELFTVLRDRMQPMAGRAGLSVRVVDGGHHDVLHGLVDGRPVTLIDCLSLGTGQGGSEDFSVSLALFGVALREADTVFDRATVAIEGLTVWSGQSALRIDPKSPPSIGVAFPDEELVASCPGVVFRLRHTTIGFSPEYRGDAVAVSVRDEVHLIVETDAPVSFGDLRRHVAGVVDLVSIARRARPRTLSFSLREAGSAVDAYGVRAIWKERPSKRRKREEVAFTATDLGFDALMTTWTTRRKDLVSAVNLLRATWDDGWYLEPSVLALATALESLASTFDLPLKMNNSDYKAMREQIVAAAPEDRQDWLRGVLGPLNGPSLKEKILAVADRLPQEVRERLVPLEGTWADRLARVRNDLSHRGSSTVEIEVLATLRQVTATVLYLVLLKELGLPDEHVRTAMERDGYLSYACTRSARDLAAPTR